MTTRVSSSVLANTAVTTGTYGGAGQTPVITVDQQGRLTYSANTATVANTFSSGSWTITVSGTKLYFAYGGVNVFSIDSSGNIIAKADITGFGTP